MKLLIRINNLSVPYISNWKYHSLQLFAASWMFSQLFLFLNPYHSCGPSIWAAIKTIPNFFDDLDDRCFSIRVLALAGREALASKVCIIDMINTVGANVPLFMRCEHDPDLTFSFSVVVFVRVNTVQYPCRVTAWRRVACSHPRPRAKVRGTLLSR